VNIVSTIENVLEDTETAATALGPLLALVPGIGPYAGVITAALPELIKAAEAVAAATGAPATGAVVAGQVAAHLDPSQPNNPALARAASPSTSG